MRIETSLLRTAGATLLLAGMAGTAYAGGFARGTADTDILFDEGNFNMRAGVTVVVPSQKFSANPNPALVGTQVYDRYAVPSAAFKFDISESFRCAGTYTQNAGASQNYGSPKIPSGKLLEEFVTNEFGATCSVRFDVGTGVLSVLGGVFAEDLDYSRVTSLVGLGFPAGVNANLDLSGQEYGWRVGLAYEVPEYALRAQILYRSGTDYGADGTLTVPGALVGLPLVPSVTVPAVGMGSLPESVEFKAQTGIAPGWLAFGSVKWMNWSVLEALTVTSPVTTIVDTYDWRDGWTLTGGVGHAFDETYSGRISLTWDRGVSTGWDLRGDVWTVAIGGSARDKIGGEFRGGIGISYLSSIAETNYAPGLNQAADSGYAVSFNGGYSLAW